MMALIAWRSLQRTCGFESRYGERRPWGSHITVYNMHLEGPSDKQEDPGRFLQYRRINAGKITASVPAFGQRKMPPMIAHNPLISHYAMQPGFPVSAPKQQPQPNRQAGHATRRIVGQTHLGIFNAQQGHYVDTLLPPPFSPPSCIQPTLTSTFLRIIPGLHLGGRVGTPQPHPPGPLTYLVPFTHELPD